MIMSRSFERMYPLIFGAAAGAICFFAQWGMPNDDGRLSSLLSASISTSAIFVGFLATVKAILMALPDSPIKTQLKDSDEISTLADYLSCATTSNLAFCLLNIGSFFFSANELPRALVVAWFAVGVFALSAFWRVGRIMILILRLV